LFVFNIVRNPSRPKTVAAGYEEGFPVRLLKNRLLAVVAVAFAALFFGLLSDY